MDQKQSYPSQYRSFFVKYHAAEYWEAHEVLEELWQTQRENHFYQGLIQIAAIMHQLERGKVRGARKLAKSAIGHLTPFYPIYEEVDIDAVLEWLHNCLDRLPEKVPILEPEEVNRLRIGRCPLPTL